MANAVNGNSKSDWFVGLDYLKNKWYEFKDGSHARNIAQQKDQLELDNKRLENQHKMQILNRKDLRIWYIAGGIVSFLGLLFVLRK